MTRVNAAMCLALPKSPSGRRTGRSSTSQFITATDMAASNSSRLIMRRAWASCPPRIHRTAYRGFASTTTKALDSPSSSGVSRRPPQMTSEQASSLFTGMLDDKKDSGLGSFLNDDFGMNYGAEAAQKPHRFHVYATKHNTHITVVQPPQTSSGLARSAGTAKKSDGSQTKKSTDMLLSLSTGNIGFRKAGRGSYDAAYQLAAFTLKQLAERGVLREIRKLEVVLRGFGAGREAVTKALLGAEGRLIRNRISAVIDATRLRQGGPRAPKPRRLG